MKNWILLTLFLPAMIGCCATHRLQTSNEKWNSPSKLERIARDYARQHEIEFDFATAHPEVGWISGNKNVATIAFYHGLHETFFQANIDREGNVLWAGPVEPPP